MNENDDPTNEELKYELPSYADMVEFLERIQPKVSGSEQYKMTNILEVLRLSAVIIFTEESHVEAKAIDRINDILR